MTVRGSAALPLRELAGARDLLGLAAAFPDRYPGLLESVARGNARARYDILAGFPEDSLALVAPGDVRDGAGNRRGASFLDALDAAWSAEPDASADESPLPFRGGWLLYLGYELAGEIEPSLRLPSAPGAGAPIALALRCPAAIVVDHAEARTFLVTEPGRQDLLDRMRADLEAVPEYALHERRSPLARTPAGEEHPSRFIDGVARIAAHLDAGDVFQVNLSREWRVTLAEDAAPARVYAALREANPAPFAALLQQPGFAVMSSSPERLVEVRGRVVQTRPIAGTRPRMPGDDDAARVRELIGHVKERAEHVMLIDLERNDLGRICEPGSVVVDELMAVESYRHVHHIVSNVRGRLRAGVTPGRAIRAVFPGGTITGCPKVRCMQIIADIERTGRGAYTGSIGYLNRNGDMDLNILIRTFSATGCALSLRAGAGIVTDSEPGAELEETRAKARGPLRALGQPQ